MSLERLPCFLSNRAVNLLIGQDFQLTVHQTNFLFIVMRKRQLM